MSYEVTWIKLKLAMFDDEKIRLIESMPEADTILLIWIKLLVQAGKANADGFLILSETIPYTDEMLATLFRRNVTSVRMALQTFERLGMIEKIDGVLKIKNWEKHQNIEGMDRVRQLTTDRVRRYRERKMLEKQAKEQDRNCSATGNVTVTDGNALDIREVEEEKRILMSGGACAPPDPATPDTPTNGHKRNWETATTRQRVERILAVLNEESSAHFQALTAAGKPTAAYRLIEARIKDGHGWRDFLAVIRSRAAEWRGDDAMRQYLRPKTLFTATNFQDYLGRAGE